MTKIKICGVKDKACALAAAEAGADFIGLVFAPSRRQVSPAQAKEIVDTIKGCGTTRPSLDKVGGGEGLLSNSFPLVVGVFVNTKASEVNKIADFCGLDWVQLSGDEPWEYCSQIVRPVIKAIHIGRHKSSEEIMSELEFWTDKLGRKSKTKMPRSKLHSKNQNFVLNLIQGLPFDFLFCLDSDVKDKYGGTGIAFDWRVAQPVAKRFPIIIAGGLTPQNVAEVIKVASPWGVDVSSGVEVDGAKDVAKVKAFIAAVRNLVPQSPVFALNLLTR